MRLLGVLVVGAALFLAFVVPVQTVCEGTALVIRPIRYIVDPTMLIRR
jgi:hypothetical protein